MRYLVTAYTNPDLDGTACAIAYAELLQKKGENAFASLSGNIHVEAQFVLRSFHINVPPIVESILKSTDNVILVDASDPLNISQKINLEQIVEIIDHRQITHLSAFRNAEAQIELVGSCATLIAEKFYEEGEEISHESAALIYGAIISNTVNFQANVTTERDKKMAKWILTKIDMPSDFIKNMFQAKSKIAGPLLDVFLNDFAFYIFQETKVGIAQLEIVDAEEFLNKNMIEIQETLQKLKRMKKLDVTFLSIIDIDNGRNIYACVDEQTKVLLEKALSVSFAGLTAQKDGIMMRNTITPLIKTTIEAS